jgi:hypothetical protein
MLGDQRATSQTGICSHGADITVEEKNNKQVSKIFQIVINAMMKIT